MPVTWGKTDQPAWQVLSMTGHDLADLSSARRWTEARLGTIDQALRGDVMLVAGELLDNAYSHAGGPVQLRLQLLRDPCEVVVAVVDHGSGTPRLRVAGDDGGRGLLLVDRVCLAWGVDHHAGGKVVWGKVTSSPS